MKTIPFSNNVLTKNQIWHLSFGLQTLPASLLQVWSTVSQPTVMVPDFCYDNLWRCFMISSRLGFICERADPEPCALRRIPLPTTASSTFQVKWAVFREDGVMSSRRSADILFTGMLRLTKSIIATLLFSSWLLSPCRRLSIHKPLPLPST